ncbi:AAA family ATPase [Holzapfeliella sp. JNUCC 80]
MSILPENKPQQTRDTPRNFFIWGATMSGKSYLAERFPNPLFLNTDGNALANKAPSIQMRNIKREDGTLKQSVLTQLEGVIRALQNEQHTYETVVIDVIEDLVVMIEQEISIKNNVQTISDVGYGKGYALLNQVLQELVLDFKNLGMNVVYISRIAEKTDANDEPVEVPGLKTKYYNIVNGNSDLVIKTTRKNKNYLRFVTDKRKQYQKELVDDPKILRILENVVGVFKPERNTK